MEEDKEKYVLVMPLFEEAKEEKQFYPSSGMSGAVGTVQVSYEALADFAASFTGFELDNIELHLKGLVKSGGITQLVVGLEGEAGVKVTLKKKTT